MTFDEFIAGLTPAQLEFMRVYNQACMDSILDIRQRQPILERRMNELEAKSVELETRIAEIEALLTQEIIDIDFAVYSPTNAA